LLKDIPEIGLLQSRQLTHDVARSLPRHNGSNVAGGELFVEGEGADGGSDCSSLTFWLAGNTAVTAVLPHPRLASDKLIPHLVDLEVDWENG